MKFICDVHISLKLAKHLTNQGFECVHVNTILDKWFTADSAIAKHADLYNYTIITKDFDFKNSYLISKAPKKLVKVNLGNISNQELMTIFDKFISDIESIDKNSNQYMIEMASHFLKVTY